MTPIDGLISGALGAGLPDRWSVLPAVLGAHARGSVPGVRRGLRPDGRGPDPAHADGHSAGRSRRIYLFRLAAFVLIIVAVLAKNLKRERD
jgi:hypothetical protein